MHLVGTQTPCAHHFPDVSLLQFLTEAQLLACPSIDFGLCNDVGIAVLVMIFIGLILSTLMIKCQVIKLP